MATTQKISEKVQRPRVDSCQSEVSAAISLNDDGQDSAWASSRNHDPAFHMNKCEDTTVYRATMWGLLIMLGLP